MRRIPVDAKQADWPRTVANAVNSLIGGTAGVVHTHIIADVTGLQTALDAKADETITLTAGTGLTGGGNLTANRTFTLANTAVTPGSYTNSSITVDAQGRITSAANGTTAVTSVTGTAPIVSSGGATPAISITAASGADAGSMSAADFSKLAGIAAGATANSTDAFLLARANHTGTQAVSTILAAATARFFGRITASGGAGEELTGTQATTLLDAATVGLQGLMSAADKTKLDGIAAAATANQTDAYLLARANHTGTQLASTISDFSEATDDRVAALLVASTGITLTYTDASDTLAVAVTSGSSARFPLVDGSVPPNLVYEEDGSLVYVEI